jgi:hypothetical protein
VISSEISHYKENDKTGRSKNIYDILFKSIARKENTNEIIIQRQAILIKTFLKHLVSVFNDYFKLVETGKPEGSDIECEIKYLMKKIVQLEISVEVYSILYSFMKD